MALSLASTFVIQTVSKRLYLTRVGVGDYQLLAHQWMSALATVPLLHSFGPIKVGQSVWKHHDHGLWLLEKVYYISPVSIPQISIELSKIKSEELRKKPMPITWSLPSGPTSTGTSGKFRLGSKNFAIKNKTCKRIQRFSGVQQK